MFYRRAFQSIGLKITSSFKMGNKLGSSKPLRSEAAAIPSKPYQVCVVGSGNWGSVIAKIVGGNVQAFPEIFQLRVTMYVYEEVINGVKLTEIINRQHENVKYLPGCRIPENVVAVPDILDATAEADILIFVLPHQFITALSLQMAGKIKKNAIAVSLVKGLNVIDGKLQLISTTIRKSLGIRCAVLMGANVANEVAEEYFCESTIGCRDQKLGRILKDLFQTPYFRIVVVPDEETVELCGALKNVVAMGAGFIDGMQYGDNTKAAAIRLGLMEMVAFTKYFFPDARIETFMESCGVADLITSCYSGRNHRVAIAFAAGSGKTLDELEREMLNGQKLQGPPTAAEVFSILKKLEDEGKPLMNRFPIFVSVHKICSGLVEPDCFIACLKNHPEHV